MHPRAYYGILENAVRKICEAFLLVRKKCDILKSIRHVRLRSETITIVSEDFKPIREQSTMGHQKNVTGRRGRKRNTSKEGVIPTQPADVSCT